MKEDQYQTFMTIFIVLGILFSVLLLMCIIYLSKLVGYKEKQILLSAKTAAKLGVPATEIKAILFKKSNAADGTFPGSASDLT